MAVRFSGNKYSSISFPPRKRAQGSRRDVTKITKRGGGTFYSAVLRGEVDARHFSGTEILRPPRPELSGVPHVVQRPMCRGTAGSVAVTFSRSSVSFFYAARYAARGAHRASPAEKYLLDHPRAEFLRV